MPFFSSIINIFLSRNEKIVAQCRDIVGKINSLEEEVKLLTDSELRDKTYKFREILNSGSSKEEILPEVFAVVREVASRALNMRHYDVQLIGGIMLDRGTVAEMRTGEGKTLVATLPAYLNALNGKVHVVTVNDYLTERDHGWMSKVYNFLGVSSGFVVSATNKSERKLQYSRDIVYVVNSELGFDYLKDNMCTELDEMVLPENAFNYAIVDEVDSILIDEARTPLIISGPSHKSSELYLKVDRAAKKIEEKFYEIQEKHQVVQLTEDGVLEMEKILQSIGVLEKTKSLYDMECCELLNHVNQALKANFILKNNKDYIIGSGEALIIDEFTGRISEGRRYSSGLHQAIEAKEGLEIRSENQTLASITYQNLFRMYKKLAGMTGTAMTESKELFSVYGLEVVSVPTNKPILRQDLSDGMFKTETDKVKYIVKLVSETHKTGQPILIGTPTITKSEELSLLLNKANIKHNVLNAKHHEREAHIIAEAGRKNAVTIATNMAGRGTDIRLGGSLDDLLMRAIEEDVGDHEAIKRKTDAIKVEHEREKEEVVALGGLFIIGSARNESRRVDNQLKGRSGRDGDPGKSQFFLSLEDDLLRIFGGDKVKGLLDVVGFKEAEPIYSQMLHGIISKSQKRLENFHFEMRKNVVKYDDIANEQRKFVYGQRMSFLKMNTLDDAIRSVIDNCVSAMVESCSSLATETQSKSAGYTIEPKILIEMISPVAGVFFNASDVKEIESKCEIRTEADLTNLRQTVEDILWLAYLERVRKYKEVRINVERFVLLNTLDECWKSHLQILGHLREGVHLRAYGNKDPFVEYRNEAFNALQNALRNFEELSMKRLFSVHVQPLDRLPEEINSK